MAICITFGTHEFSSQLKGYEGVTAQCHNCGNWAGHCQTRWPWFTVCFIPVIPLGGKHKEVYCHICRFAQDISYRPDVQSQLQQGAPGGPGAPPPGGPMASGGQGHPGGGPPPQQGYGYK